MKTVLVTGANRGIGAAIATRFKQEAYTVYGTSTTGDAAEDVDHMFKVDFSNRESLNDFIELFRETPLDTLVNCAGINNPKPFLDITADNFDSTYQVNLYAPFALCQMAIPKMLERWYGRIVNISSIWGKISRPNVAAYSATKFGIDGMTLSLANEYASQNILANCVSPGFIDTEMTRKNLPPERIEMFNKLTPAGRLGTPEEIANLVYFLGSEKNTFISGQNIACDGGFTRA
jgi:NAD(P)-dependent dehydrogenase (short-subunit alcohol dehydrogenase family)